MNMQEHLQRYFEACLIVNDKQWVTDAEFSNIIRYYIFNSHTGFARRVTLQFNSGSGYVEVDASFPFKQATGPQGDKKTSMMVYYKDPDKMSLLKEAFREIAQLA